MPATGSTLSGLIIAAPASGSGKTLVTLGLLRHLRGAGPALGVRAASAKAGPDYIDPAFHAAALGRACLNLDPWAMRPATLAACVAAAAEGADLMVCEGVMGLFDGATLDDGSTADLAARAGWPVVLVVDAGAQGASAAAVVRGFAGHRPDVAVGGVIFNRVGSPRHETILRDAMAASGLDIPVIGCLPRLADLRLPERHLGLVQARETAGLEDFLDRAAEAVAAHLDVARLVELARPSTLAAEPGPGPALPPLGQRIAIAEDDAFAFAYPHVLHGWRRAGAEVLPFSPLADDAPAGDADAVYLPGGYPELHAGRLAAAEGFLGGLRAAAGAGKPVFGECGGYMVLGETLEDADGATHIMAGLLPLRTSFRERRLHLGYRRATLAEGAALGKDARNFRGHEFHYATILAEGPGDPLFARVANARGEDMGPQGRRAGSVAGSFVHLIDREDKS